MRFTRHPARDHLEVPLWDDAAPLWCIADAGSWQQHRQQGQDTVSATHRVGRCAAHGMTGGGVIQALACFALVAMPPSAHAEVKGTFVGPGTYATAEGCKKLAAIEAGGEKNVGTMPETLTADGFTSWEGSCTFESFTETQKDKVWKAKMQCAEEATEGPESDIFERLPDGMIKVTIMDNSTIMQRCDTDKGK